MANVEMPLPLLAERPSKDRHDKRARLFRETLHETTMRWILGAAYACQPVRVRDLPYLVRWMLADLARGGTRVPDSSNAHPRPDSFAGIARDICPETVLAAARHGFFPWCHIEPTKWWTRKNRMVLFLGEQHLPKRLRRDMRKTPYRVTFDQAFEDVIKACAGRRQGRPQLTWITPKIMRLYAALHDLGHVHSFEVWRDDGQLVGGGYGISVGRIFTTESQFSLESNTSKMGFVTLNHHLAKWGYVLNDGKDYTQTIDSLGFRLISRAEFEALLAEHAHAGSHPGPWKVEADLAAIAG